MKYQICYKKVFLTGENKGLRVACSYVVPNMETGVTEQFKLKAITKAYPTVDSDGERYYVEDVYVKRDIDA